MLVQDTTFFESWHNQLQTSVLSEDNLEEEVQMTVNGECTSANSYVQDIFFQPW